MEADAWQRWESGRLSSMSLIDLQVFFRRRPWLRPSDYQLLQRGEITPSRKRQLAIFATGYLVAKH